MEELSKMCENQKQGCQALCIHEHEQFCEFRYTKCRVNVECKGEGSLNQLVSHLETHHHKILDRNKECTQTKSDYSDVVNIENHTTMRCPINIEHHQRNDVFKRSLTYTPSLVHTLLYIYSAKQLASHSSSDGSSGYHPTLKCILSHVLYKLHRRLPTNNGTAKIHP
ncbi:hypothetical protein J6590_036662 [Homalodisca vitripennis]|nr:hypothetical protein J6590_036662 [Homalodisca vitripennis]